MRRPPELPGRRAKSTMQTGVSAILCLRPTAVRPWIGNICENIQIVASDRGPCTLRVRRNYGLRGPGIPLPPHRPPRSAVPTRGALSGAGSDLQRRPRCGQDASRSISSKEQMTTMLVLKRLAALAAAVTPGLADRRGGFRRLRTAVALADGFSAGRHAGHGQHRLVPRLPALADHRRSRCSCWCCWSIVIVRFNARANPTPSRTTHNTLLEVAWTLVPVIILVAIAVPSFKLLFLQLTIPPADLTVKATGKQWYWSYSLSRQPSSSSTRPACDRGQRAQGRPAAPARRRQRDGGAGQQGRARAGDRRRRDPRLRGAVVRHQDRRRSGPAQRDLVQGDPRRHLLRPVLRAVRQGPRLHADRGARGERPGLRRPGSSRRRRSSPPTTAAPARNVVAAK